MSAVPLVPGVKSQPSYAPLAADPFARRHLLVATPEAPCMEKGL